MGVWVYLCLNLFSAGFAVDHASGPTGRAEITDEAIWNERFRNYVFELRSRSNELLDRHIAEEKFQKFSVAFGTKLASDGFGSFNGLIWNNLGRGMNTSHHEAFLFVADLWKQSLSDADRAKLIPRKDNYETERWKSAMGWFIHKSTSKEPLYRIDRLRDEIRQIALTSGPLAAADLETDPIWKLFKKSLIERGDESVLAELAKKYIYWRNLGHEFVNSKEWFSAFTGGTSTEKDDRVIEWYLKKARGETPLPDYTEFVEGRTPTRAIARTETQVQPVQPVQYTQASSQVYSRVIPWSDIGLGKTYRVRASNGTVHDWTISGFDANGRPIWRYVSSFCRRLPCN